MSRAVTVLLVVLPVLAGCEADLGDGSGPRIPNTCVVKADNPHFSTTGGHQGLRQIVGKGWFICSTSLEDAVLTVDLQRLVSGDWEHEAGATLTKQPVAAKRKYVQPVIIGCRDGRFRVRVRLSAHDRAGQHSRSPWYYSKSVTDPCSGR